MIETQQEKKAMVAALNREIEGNRSRYESLGEQLDELKERDIPGYEPQIALLMTEMKGCERAIEAAGREIMIRTGHGPSQPQKRGPGRPPKTAA